MLVQAEGQPQPVKLYLKYLITKQEDQNIVNRNTSLGLSFSWSCPFKIFRITEQCLNKFKDNDYTKTIVNSTLLDKFTIA